MAKSNETYVKGFAIKIGKVTTGEIPAVTNVGTEEHPVLDFVLPTVGRTASIKIGKVTIGERASIVNVGTEEKAILDFVLPIKGIRGDTGSIGNMPTIQIGSVSLGNYASVRNSGTNTKAILDFVFPYAKAKGDKGDPGEQGMPGPQGERGEQGVPGQDGEAATIAIGDVTIGDQPSVTNSGDEHHAILDFVLPRSIGDMSYYTRKYVTKRDILSLFEINTEEPIVYTTQEDIENLFTKRWRGGRCKCPVKQLKLQRT